MEITYNFVTNPYPGHLETECRDFLFTTAKVYIVKVVHAPLYDDYSATEAEFNHLTDEKPNALGVTLIDWSQKIAACKQNCFHADGVHPNEQGYVLFEQAIADAVANK